MILSDNRINYSNDGYGYARGIDLFVKKNVGKIEGHVAASWLDASERVRARFDIIYKLSTIMKTYFLQAWFLGLRFDYAIGKPFTSGPGNYHDSRLPSFQRADLSLNRMFRLNDTNLLIAFLAVSNVLGRNNIFDYRYSDDYTRRSEVLSPLPRSFYFGFTVTL